MTKDKLFQPGYAVELLQIAAGDLDTATILLEHPTRGRRENICFNAQQAIEKALKAVLCAKGKPVPMTHSIELILDRLGTNGQPPLSDALIELTDFATIRRYQEGDEILTDDDLDATVNAAAAVLKWAESVIVGQKP